jgi:hypothetical protein
MAERSISVSYNFRPDEPSGGQEADIRRAFAALGWRVTYYGGGMSNVDRCFLDIQSDTAELDHPTLIATLQEVGIPLSDEPYTGTSILGDVAMESHAVDWAPGREHVIQGVRLAVSPVTVLGRDQWFDGEADGLLPTARIGCDVSLADPTAVQTPFDVRAEARTGGGEVLGNGGMGCSPAAGARHADGQMILVRLPPETVDLHLRVLDLHRAWRVLFRGVRVIS